MINWKIWIAIPLMWSGLAGLCLGAEPIQVLVEGLEGEALKNVRAALTLPSGMVQEGVVKQLLLEIFLRRIPEKVREALEPFGYFQAQAKVETEKSPGEQEVLRVTVIPGDPVKVSSSSGCRWVTYALPL